MRYLVSEGAIGPDGRRVRCANCGHEWKQEPEIGLDEELFGEAPAFLDQEEGDDDALDMEETVENPVDETGDDDGADFQSILQKEIEATPIPEGVKPAHENDPVLEQLQQKKKKSLPVPSGDKFAGYAVAASIYIFILAAILYFHPQISRAWPPSNLLYDLVGMKPVMPGEGLSLEELRAERLEDRVVLKGTIVNLRDGDLKVPAVMATFVDDHDKVLDQILIPPPIARIKAEGSVAFEGIYPKILDEATNVTYAFSFIKVKPQEEDTKEESPAAEEGHEVPTALDENHNESHSDEVDLQPADPAKHHEEPAHH